eukprot:8058574-Lingulodinium_polyedra.AAC.1
MSPGDAPNTNRRTGPVEQDKGNARRISTLAPLLPTPTRPAGAGLPQPRPWRGCRSLGRREHHRCRRQGLFW